ncbi:MAG: hypothetical protein SPJ19_04210, partial [Candidatus Borkfalkiaceae bacterium]|nr:hypothetical protein [Christensenellaceae bacterium]
TTKENTHQTMGVFFAVGHPTEMNYPNNLLLQVVVVDAHTQINLLLSPSPSRYVSFIMLNTYKKRCHDYSVVAAVGLEK